MTQTPPNPVAPPPQNFDAATDAVNARLEAEFGHQRVDNPDGTPAAAPAPPQAPAADPDLDLFDDAAVDGMNFDGLQYRDGVKLREQITKVQQKFRPFRDAFGDLSDEQRQLLLDSAPNLAADLGTLSAVAQRLQPEDRAWFVETMELLARDPVAGADRLAAGADAVRQAFGAPPPAPGAEAPRPSASAVPDDPFGSDDDQPITRADLQRWQQERDEAANMARLQDEIANQARELGYDPSAQEGTDAYDDYSYLLTVAGRPSVQGDLEKANAIVKAREQKVIDAFVEGKSNDATRPAVPANPGGVAASGERELTSFEDARAAMDARLDSTLGPDPRRRTG